MSSAAAATLRTGSQHGLRTAALADGTTAQPRPKRYTGIPLEQARLLPRYRTPNQRTTYHPLELQTHILNQLVKTRTKPVPSPGSLRGIPVIGHGGAIPGTQPGK